MSRRFGAVVSVVLAVVVAVLVNVWTAGWYWATGVGLAVLVVGQCAFEWFRTCSDDVSAPRRHQRVEIEQDIEEVRDSDVIGVRESLADRDVRVAQRLGLVDRSVVVGLDSDRGDG